MRKWGLHCIWVLLLVGILSGCGSGDSNSASNMAMNSGAANKGEVTTSFSESTANQASSEALPASADAKGGGSGQEADSNPATAENTDSAGAGFTGSDVVAGLNKKLIYRANLIMEVEDYAKAQTEVRNMITLANGYIIEFTENMSDYEQGGTFILKVPASGFSSLLNNLEKVENESIQRSIQGQDVSEEYVDLESRLKAKQLMEEQYINFMSKATKSSDLVAFANELGSIQESIEKIKGRMRYIDQNVSFSTVELRLYQTDESISSAKATEEGPLLDRASEALKDSLKLLSMLFQGLVVFLAAILPLLIIGGVISAIVLWYRKGARRRQEERAERSRLIRVQNQAKDREPLDTEQEKE